MIRWFFGGNESILQEISEIGIERLKDIISVLNINFCKLNITGVHATLLDFIFDNCYYELNYDMIHSIVAYKNVRLCNFLKSKNYTTIVQLKYEPILKHIHENFELYVDNIVLQKENTKESIQALLEILDRCINDLERCDKIITHIDFTVDSVTEICNNHIGENSVNVQSIWDMLLKYDKLNVSWGAIHGYWKEFKLTTSLCDYIKKHSITLSIQNADCLDDDFKKSIILSKIDNLVFKRILSQIRMDPLEIGFDQISKDKLEIMVQKHILSFTVENYNEMEKHVPELCTQFIVLNQQKFEEIFDQINLSSTVFESLILNNDITNTLKEIILENYGVEYMTQTVATFICNTAFSINHAVFMSTWEVLSNIENRKSLFFNHLDTLELEDFEQYIVTLGEPYKKLERKTHRHEQIIPDNKQNRDLVLRLQYVHYLTSFEYEMKTHHNPKQEIPVIRCRVKAKQT